jgi:hypothetical protein
LTNRTPHAADPDRGADAAGRELADRTSTGARAHLAATFADTPHLAAEIIRIAAELAGARLDVANLAAAALATIAAHQDGEPDPLSYLVQAWADARRDEIQRCWDLAAQNQPPGTID